MKKFALLLSIIIFGCISLNACSKDKDDKKSNIQQTPQNPDDQGEEKPDTKPAFDINNFIGEYKSTETTTISITVPGLDTFFPDFPSTIPIAENEVSETIISLKKGSADNKIILTNANGIEIPATLHDSTLIFENQNIDAKEMLQSMEISAMLDVMMPDLDEMMREVIASALNSVSGTVTLRTTGILSNKTFFSYTTEISGTVSGTVMGFPLTVIINGNVMGEATRK